MGSATISYGPAPEQYGVLSVPPGDGPHPVVVFIHGGFWRNRYAVDLAAAQAADVVASGYAAWNVEYRRVGDAGGGYPGTLADVAVALDGLDRLRAEHRLDLERVAVVGHSAGGHLSLWAGQRVGALLEPKLVVGQAPVADLRTGLDLGRGAVVDFMGAVPEEAPGDYAAANPAEQLPVRTPQLIVHGALDDVVPPDRSVAYQALADDPDKLEVMFFDGADHFAVIDPAHASWTAVKARLP